MRCTITTTTETCARVCQWTPEPQGDYYLSGDTLWVEADDSLGIRWEITKSGKTVWDFGWGSKGDPMEYTQRGAFTIGASGGILRSFLSTKIILTGDLLGIRMTLKDIYNQTIIRINTYI